MKGFSSSILGSNDTQMNNKMLYYFGIKCFFLCYHSSSWGISKIQSFKPAQLSPSRSLPLIILISRTCCWPSNLFLTQPVKVLPKQPQQQLSWSGPIHVKVLHFYSVCGTQTAWRDKNNFGRGDISNRMCLDESGDIMQVVLPWLLFCVGCSIYSPLGPSSCAFSDAGLLLGLW